MVLDVRGLLPLVNGTEIKPVVDPKAKAEDIAAMTEKIADWDPAVTRKHGHRSP